MAIHLALVFNPTGNVNPSKIWPNVKLGTELKVINSAGSFPNLSKIPNSPFSYARVSLKLMFSSLSCPIGMIVFVVSKVGMLNNGSSLLFSGSLESTGTCGATTVVSNLVNEASGHIEINGNLRNNGALNNAGTVILSSESKLYGTGNFTQTQGTLAVDGAITQDSIEIQGGTVAGSGIINTDVNNSGGTIAPGNSPGFIYD